MAGHHKVKTTRLERRLGRYELMSWMNSFLRIDYTKVEEFSDGVAYCQVLDAMIPGSVPLHKVNFHPRNKQEKVRNLKLLDRILEKQNLSKSLDVTALASGNFQENNEMLQWCYAMVQRNCPHVFSTYKALERRVAAMKKQKQKHSSYGFAPTSTSTSTSTSFQTLTTNRLIPSEVYSSLIFGEGEQEGEIEIERERERDGDTDTDDMDEALQEAELALLRTKISPDQTTRSRSPGKVVGGDVGIDLHQPFPTFPKRALHQSFDKVVSESSEKMEELHKIEDILLEIEENLVLRLKNFDKLRENVAIERERRDFFYNKLLGVEQLCELIPDSNPCNVCRKILTE